MKDRKSLQRIYRLRIGIAFGFYLLTFIWPPFLIAAFFVAMLAWGPLVELDIKTRETK